MMSPRGSFGALGRIQKILRFSLIDLLIAQATVVLGCILIDGPARFASIALSEPDGSGVGGGLTRICSRQRRVRS